VGAICDGNTDAAGRALAVAADLVSTGHDPAERAAVRHFRMLRAQQGGRLAGEFTGRASSWPGLR
jgi:hypothetical protein